MKTPKLLSAILVFSILISCFAICPSVTAAKGKHTITFDVQGIGETPDPIMVDDGDRFLYLRENGANNPTADGYVFHCWVTTLDFYPDELEMSNTAAYLETPIHEDMTLYAIWYKIIDEIEIEANPPFAGDVIGIKKDQSPDFYREYQWPRPVVQSLNEGVCVQDDYWSAAGTSAVWLEDASDLESIFKGSFEAGKEYGVFAQIAPLFGYEFADKVSITFNGKLLTTEHIADYNLCIVSAPIICAERLLGDVDGDGEIMITDAAYLQRKVAGMEIPFVFNDTASDVDGDKEITVMDAPVIQRYLCGLKTLYSVAEAIN